MIKTKKHANYIGNFRTPKLKRLINFLKSSGNTDETLFQAIKELDISCEICKQYHSPKTVVGLPMAPSPSMNVLQWT